MPLKNIKLGRIRIGSVIMVTAVVCAFATIYVSTHYYIHSRLTWGLGIDSRNVSRGIAFAMFLFANAYFMARLLAKIKIGPTAVALDWIGSIWMGMVFYLFMTALAGHLIMFVASRVSVDTTPYKFAYALAVVVVASSTCAWGYYRSAYTLEVSRFEAPMKNLPPELDGMKVAQVSDLHLGIIVDKRRAERLVSRINELDPDLVVMTGDLVDEAPGLLNGIVSELAKIKSKYGVYASAGNHEFFHGVKEVVDITARANVKFLRNEGTLVAGGLMLYGIDDPVAGRLGAKVFPFESVIGPEAKEKPSILLYHRPNKLEKAASLGIDLMLTGHTHNGQLWPFRYLVMIFFPKMTGLYYSGATTMYVSRGTGTWGAPMRLRTTPEIVEITLRKRN